jgi:3-oxoacyl-[acyl-carrier-protein] synthase-3
VKRPFVYLAGVGRCSPDRVLRNNEFAGMGLDTNDEWIVQRTGIRERRIAAPNENNRTMSAAASEDRDGARERACGRDRPDRPRHRLARSPAAGHRRRVAS